MLPLAARATVTEATLAGGHATISACIAAFLEAFDVTPASCRRDPGSGRQEQSGP
jgi:hypothetical protein